VARTRPAANAAYLIAANLLAKLFSLILVLYATRTLGRHLYGNYVEVAAFVGLFSFLTDLGLSTVAVRDVAQDRSLATRYVSNMLLLRLFFSALDIVLIVVLAQQFVAPSLRAAIYVYALALIPLTVMGTLQLAFQFSERQGYTAVLNVGTTVVRIILSLLVLYVGHHVLALMLVFTAVTTVSAGVTAWLVYTRFLPRRMELDFFWWPVLLKQAAPFAFLALLNYFYARVDMQLLYGFSGCEHARGNEGCSVTGLYGLAYQALDVASAVLVTSTGTALLPAINRVAVESHEALTRVIRSSYTLLLSVGVLGALFGMFYATDILRLLGDRGFSGAAPALAILVWALPCYLVLNMLGAALIAVHRQRVLMVSFAVTLVFNVVFNVLLIPHYSYIASSVLTVASEIINSIFIVVALRQMLGPLGIGATTIRVAAVAVITAAVLWVLRGYSIVVGVPIGGVVAFLGLRVLRVVGATEREALARIPVVGRCAALL